MKFTTTTTKGSMVPVSASDSGLKAFLLEAVVRMVEEDPSMKDELDRRLGPEPVTLSS